MANVDIKEVLLNPEKYPDLAQVIAKALRIDLRLAPPKDVLIEQEYNAVNKSNYRVILEYANREEAEACWRWLKEWRYAMQSDIDKGSGPCQ